ncbi:uncharacterized protein LOC121735215 isoform X2 [Aricia agestis]|nr:uncharacterized protein LOC121735215 isoform X2 [Aricia agestis]XP_041981906.1 uncharacterized protein LOC121735215 isoform X2 [Aricia agestis]
MADVNVEGEEGMKLELGKIVTEKVSESIKNIDVMGMLQKMVATQPEDEESEEIRQKLQGIMDQYEAFSDQDKEQFVTQLKDVLASKLSLKLQNTPLDMSGIEDAIRGAVMPQLYMMAAAALIVFLLIVFFGYKLYKSIKEKEKKREEKKKMKQMKKKK